MMAQIPAQMAPLMKENVIIETLQNALIDPSNFNSHLLVEVATTIESSGINFQTRLCQNGLIKLLIKVISRCERKSQIAAAKSLRILAENHRIVRNALIEKPQAIITLFKCISMLIKW